MEIRPDVILGIEAMYHTADKQTDEHDRSDYLAGGAVMALLAGAVLTKEESEYIFTWLEGLANAI